MTYIPLEAAELARRFVMLGDVCFTAKGDVLPEPLALTRCGFARIGIEAAGRDTPRTQSFDNARSQGQYPNNVMIVIPWWTQGALTSVRANSNDGP